MNCFEPNENESDRVMLGVSAFLPEAAVVAALVSVGAAIARGESAERFARALLGATIALLWVSVAALVVALVREDTSLLYVVEQTRPGTSVARRVSGLWSGAQGSLLLYVAIFVTVLMIGYRGAPAWQRVGVGLVAAGLSGASAWGADPFERVDLPPPGGVGMAPILEHGAMLIHPPMLYVGTALALAPALVRDPARARKLTFISLALLVASLGLGASWAYVELGWGGWWAWDPIENVGLIVWLLLAAAMHADLIGGGGTGERWALALRTLCWPAVIAGAAMTRTSLRTSVHAFADATELAIWLWPLAVLSGVGVLLRLRGVTKGVRHQSSRRLRKSRVAPVVVLFIATVVIALGTFRPFVGGDGTEGWFYTRSLFGLTIAGVVLIGLAPLIDVARHRRTIAVAGGGTVAAFVIALASGATQWSQLAFAASLGCGLGLVALDVRRDAVRALAHAGTLLVLVGALGGTAGTDATLSLRPGEVVEVDGHSFSLIEVNFVEGPPATVTAIVEVDGRHRLDPSVSLFPDRSLRLPEIATHSRPWTDVQAILRTADDAGDAALTIRIRPLTQLVWWGVGMIAVAGMARAFPIDAGRRSRAGKDTISLVHAETLPADDGASTNQWPLDETRLSR